MKSWTVNRGVGSMNDNLTRFISIGGIVLITTTEAPVEVPVRLAGSFSKLSAYVSANSHTTVTTTLTLRKSQADTTLVLSIAAGVTGYVEEVATSVAFAATDEVSFELTSPNNAGTTALTIQVTGLQFEPDDKTQTVTFMAARGGISFAVDSTTVYMVPAGWNEATDVEANRAFRIRTPGTASNLWVHVNANARTSDTVFRTRKNLANGAQSVTFGAGVTGSLEYTASTDSLAVGDDFDYSITTGTGLGEAIQFQMASTQFVSTIGEFIMVAAGSNAVAFNTTTFVGLGGRLLANTTEAQVEARPPFPFYFKEALTLVSANTLDQTQDVVALRQDGVTTALDIRINNLQVGLIGNTVDKVFATGSGIDFAWRLDTTTSTAGTVTMQWLAVVGLNPKGPIFQRRRTQRALLVR